MQTAPSHRPAIGTSGGASRARGWVPQKRATASSGPVRPRPEGDAYASAYDEILPNRRAGRWDRVRSYVDTHAQMRTSGDPWQAVRAYARNASLRTENLSVLAPNGAFQIAATRAAARKSIQIARFKMLMVASRGQANARGSWREQHTSTAHGRGGAPARAPSARCTEFSCDSHACMPSCAMADHTSR